MFCCGTNVVFRRTALESVGGFPENSVTEDFELSVWFHEAGWRSSYVPEVLASGLGPEDLGSYVTQQHRWSTRVHRRDPACCARRAAAPEGAVPAVGLLLPVGLDGAGLPLAAGDPHPVRGAADRAGCCADGFLAAFAPYLRSPCSRSRRSAGTIPRSPPTLATSTFWIHVRELQGAVAPSEPVRGDAEAGRVVPSVATRCAGPRPHSACSGCHRQSASPETGRRRR